MDKEIGKKLDRLIALQESILKELRKQNAPKQAGADAAKQAVSAMQSTFGKEIVASHSRGGKGPYAGVTWEEWDAMNRRDNPPPRRE